MLYVIYIVPIVRVNKFMGNIRNADNTQKDIIFGIIQSV